MQFGISNKKAGVSLVTVLLFMLVATIAATATYKWLTSEGRSSASRMLQQEAYQSSVAGIENARTWMTFHANDVGALVKAYLDGGRRPINLDARLRPLQKAGQNYHVWLTGVNTEKSTYKLKVMSAGESRNNTRHSETAIFNVDGLYQVKVPRQKVVVTVPFEHNYFGGSTHSAGHVKAYSLLINGNLEGTNPVYTDKDLIVTGNAHVTGSSIGAGGTACIGGNLDANNGVLGNDFYVVGNAEHFTFPTTSEAAHLTNANVTGNVYIGGDLGRADPKDQKFQKNVTIMGKWKTNLVAHDASVAGNLCVGPSGQVEIDNTNRVFHVDGNVWSEADYPIWWSGHGEMDPARYNRIILGNSEDSKLYIRTVHQSSDYVTLRNNRAFVESRWYYRGTAGGMGALTWDDRTHRPYPNVPAADDKYYLYKYPGTGQSGQDVDYVVSTQWSMRGSISYANYYVANEVFYTPAGFGFMPGPFGPGPGGVNHTLNMEGAKPIGSPYCKPMADKWRPECKVTPWFKSLGDIDNSFAAVTLTSDENLWKSTDKTFECAESVKTHCDAIWHEADDGCGTPKAKYKVDDILVTAYDKFESYAEKGCAKDIKNWNNDLSKNLNACYQTTINDATKKNTDLYNGYLVVKVRDGSKSDPTTPLKGKFIIIVENAMGQQSLPPTTADSYAFVYLKEGQTGDAIQPATNTGIYNYFIYTTKDIKQIMFNNADFSGSIYATAATCAKVDQFQTRNMIYNDALMKDLTSNGVICPASETDCGGAGGTSSTTEETVTPGETSSGIDAYYISMAPQLGVRLESQYKSDESLPTANGSTELPQSFIVLPRIIYLPSDPYGKLEDYYNVQGLNGSALTKSDVGVSCTGPGTLSATGTMYDGTATLHTGIYTCTAAPKAAAANLASIPFWVVVGDAVRGIPPVSFTEPSHKMGASDEWDVKISVPVRAAELNVDIYCPNPDDATWKYKTFGTNVTRDGTTCRVSLGAGPAINDFTVFTIQTVEATAGTMTFQIMPGEGYIPGMYATTQLYMASSAVLDRLDITLEQQKEYCDNHADCPSDTTGWPGCAAGGIWVEPSGVSYSTLSGNNSWLIMVGNTQEATLAKPEGFDDCVVIVPTTDNSIPANGVEANKSYTLYATAKAKANSLKVGFAGDVGSGNNPKIKLTAGVRTVWCSYNESPGAITATVQEGRSEKVCTIPVFNGETVALELQDEDAQEFNYWNCTGASCPTTSSIVSTKTYDSFAVSDNATIVLAHFGEKDQHCFFDEFKNSSVECDKSAGGETEYCIDKCGSDDVYSTCSGVNDAEHAEFTGAKWHLISGYISQIVVGPSHEIHIDQSVNKGKKESDRTAVKVLSTVNAGTFGTLKALINVPRATSSYDKSSSNIKNSGFMFRANEFGTDYFMLNLYENLSGELEAQLWRGNTSISLQLVNDNSNAVRTNYSSMVMATIEVTNEGTVIVKATIDGYYGQTNPTVYSCTFNLTDFNNTLADMAHEYVGYSMADPGFKIYGIGWISGTYNAECHDVPPTVKCSFAAVANDGVIKLNTNTKPWIGYSGWFEAKNCTPAYYYIGGSDASFNTTDGYSFSEKGLHGYTETDGTEKKTAKAWLDNCIVDNAAANWVIASNDQKAHCGAFWVGDLSECSNHENILNESKTVAGEGTEESIVFDSEKNLRAATLNITLANTDNNEVEMWLESETENWGVDGHKSHSVKMTGNTASFDVVKEFSAGLSGFDPENVKRIVFKNHGATSVEVTNITSTCANAIGINNCRAEFDGDYWNVTLQVTNKNLISSYVITAKAGDTYAGASNAFDPINSGEQIVWNGNVTYVQVADDPYANNRDKHYYFDATISGNAGQGPVTEHCTVTPEVIGSVGVNCSVIGTVASGANFPTFNVEFNGCPGAGCGYEMYLNDESTPFATGTEKNGARHAADRQENCTAAAGCPHYYVVHSTDGKFDDCRADFKVVRNAEDAPPSVTCGISINQNQFTNDMISLTDNVYFLARNSESVERQYADLVLKEGETLIGTMNLNNWSQITNRSLGNLTAGNHTYTLYYNGEAVCNASVTVNATSDVCSISGSRIEGQPLSIRVSGVRSNTQFTWTLDNKSQTIDCDATHCWNNTMKAPAAGGPYTYTVKRGTNTICTGTVSTDPILSCSATPNPVGKGLPYTFTASAAVRCTNCTFTNEANATENNIVVPAGGSWTKVRTPNSLGDKTPGLRCSTCENNAEASCTVPLKVVTPKPVFECSETLTATVGKDDNVKLKLTGILGCDDEDCDYLISGTNADGQYHSGCTNTSCNLPAITNKTKTDGQTDTYQVTLKNDAGETTKDCEVTFTAGPTITCGCVAVCGEGCQTRIRTTSLNNTNFTGCMFFKDISTLQFNNYTLNGDPRTGQFCWENAANCATKLAAIDKIDGGYYVKVENQTGYMIVNGSPAEDPCAGSGAGQGPEPVVITIGRDIQNYYNPSQEQEYDNGTCFSLVGTWDDCCYHPTPALNCQNVSGSGMTWSYGGNPTYVSTPNGNWKQNFGVTLQQTTTTTTFIENVCVTSGSGSKIKCKFEN